MADEVERLTPPEALALAGLLRKLIREDGRFTDAERQALSMVATSFAQVDEAALVTGDYRSGAEAPAAVGEESLYALIERAGEQFPDDAAVRAAALAITRPEARATIHALLFEVAASDVISEGEASLLDWLAEKWEIEVPQDLPGEETDAG